MATGILIQSIISLFFILAIGFFSGYFKIVDNEVSSGLSDVIINIMLPITIFNSIVRPFDTELLFNTFIMLLLSLFVHIIFIVVGVVSAKFLNIHNQEKGIWLYSLSFSNSGFMGLPLLHALLGDDALFYASMYNVVFNALSFSFGIRLFSIGSDHREPLRLTTLLLKGPIIAVIFGILFFFLQIPIPGILHSGLTSLAGATTPLSMFTIGLMLSKNKVSEMFHEKIVYVLCFMRLLVIPFLLILIFKLIPVSDFLKKILVIIAAMPVAATMPVLAERYDGNAKLAVNAVFMTSLLCIFSIPLAIFALEKF